MGVDGLSAPFLPLTALLGAAVVLASWNSVQRLVPFYHALLLALSGITMGVFCALDLIAFFLFWELTLAPCISSSACGASGRSAATPPSNTS